MNVSSDTELPSYFQNSLDSIITSRSHKKEEVEICDLERYADLIENMSLM